MGTTQSSAYKINYEDMQLFIKNNKCIINTLPPEQQDCLIKKTINYRFEEKIINDNIKNLSYNIIIYGKHSNDESVYKKYTQLIQLGFTHVFVYTGGMFEWLCLQDIYGSDQFPTTSDELDILKFKPLSQISNRDLLTN